MFLAAFFSLTFYIQMAPDAAAASDEVLARVERDANGEVARGVKINKAAFQRGVGAMTKVSRNLAVADPQMTLVARLLRGQPEFPSQLTRLSLLPLLMAQQTTAFSVLAERVAEYRRPHLRHHDWRASTMGRLIQAVAHSVRRELVLMSECEVELAPYAVENFAGLTTMARDLGAMATDPRVYDELRALAAVSPGGSNYRDYRRAMIAMLGLLRRLNGHLDRDLPPLPSTLTIGAEPFVRDLLH